MRIVQLISRMDVVGGAQVHVLELSRGLAQKGHEVIVLSMGSGIMTEELINSGIQYVELKNLKLKIRPIHDVEAIFEIRQWLKKLKPNILAVHSSKAGILGRTAGWLAGIPTVFTAHGWAFTEGVSKRKRVIYSLFEMLTGKISPGVITVSHYDYRLALKHRTVPENKMKVIHNGVSDVGQGFIADVCQSPPHLVMTARFDYPKDHLQLIDAVRPLQELDWSIDFIGGGKMLQQTLEFYERVKHGDGSRVSTEPI